MANNIKTTIEVNSIMNGGNPGKLIFKTANGVLTSAQEEILRMFGQCLSVVIEVEKVQEKFKNKKINCPKLLPLDSLRVLSIRLLKLIPEGGSVDLNGAAITLNTLKRSLYQVVNVLKAVEVISPCGVGRYQWADGEFGKCIQSFIKKMKLQDTIMQLESREKEIDSLIQFVKNENVRIVNESQHAYLRIEEIRALPHLKDETLLLLKGPPETTAFVSPDCSQLHVKATLGELNVYLCREAYDGDN